MAPANRPYLEWMYEYDSDEVVDYTTEVEFCMENYIHEPSLETRSDVRRAFLHETLSIIFMNQIVLLKDRIRFLEEQDRKWRDFSNRTYGKISPTEFHSIARYMDPTVAAVLHW